MTFAPGQTVVRETHVAGFVTRSTASVTRVKGKKIFVDSVEISGGADVFSAQDGWQLEADPAGARSRIVSVPDRPQDLWGDRSGWISVQDPPVREGWYEFRRIVDGAVDLAFYIDGKWLAGESVETLAPLTLAGGEQWQGLAEDPVKAEVEAAEQAADEAEVIGDEDAQPVVAEPS